MHITLTKNNEDVLDAKQIDTSKPRMFIFSGAGLVTKEEAPSAIDYMQTIMQENNLNPSDIDFYSSYYSEKKENEAKKINEGKEISPYSQEMAEMILYPLVEKNNKRLSNLQVSENMEKVILRGHCMGANVITEMGNSLVNRMEKLGYSEAEISRLTSKAKVILTGSGIERGKEKANFNTYSYINLSDKTSLEPDTGKLRQQIKDISNLDENTSALQMKVLKPKATENLVIANKLDIPSEQYVQNKIVEGGKVTGKEEIEKAAYKIVKNIRKGHAFGCVMQPVNYKTSEFMQSLRSTVVQSFGSAIKDTVVRHKQQEHAKRLNNQQFKG